MKVETYTPSSFAGTYFTFSVSQGRLILEPLSLGSSYPGLMSKSKTLESSFDSSACHRHQILLIYFSQVSES